MMRRKCIILLSISIIITLFAFSCSKKDLGKKDSGDKNTTRITYEESLEDFVNPERGFLRTAFVHTSNFSVLNKNTLIGYRNSQTISGTNYQVSCSLLQRVYIFDNFKNKPLSEDILDKIKEDFEVVREAGMKLILRFHYTEDTHSGGCPAGSICPPYGDAPKSVVLEHISQLKPILQQNADVIACVQEGFIGIWGESYYSDYFGDASSNGNGKYTNQNWIDRNEVLKALLDAVPKDRMVQVRTPQLKQRYIYGVGASINSPSMTESEAFDESDKARIGFHNDAFLNDPASQGFEDRGNSDTPSSTSEETVKVLEDYQKAESQFVVVGGETNAPNPPLSLCGLSGGAQEAMRDYHYTYLNAEYNRDVIKSWVSGGCFDKIRRKLGYRFVLESAILPNNAKVGGTLNIILNINNVGYAAPFNDRPIQLILRNKQTDNVITLDINTNIRKWYSGEIKLDEKLTLPSDMATGTYEVLLNMSDKYASISSRPEYSIRLANKNVWEDSTGYNDLNYSLDIK